MRPADTARLVALAAIWGASFLFIRILSPAIGAVATADLRMLIAGGALAAYFSLTGFDPGWRRWWRHYLVIGLLNSAAPFLLFGYAALELSVGSMVVFNATSPMWGALLSALVLREQLSTVRIAGLLLGAAGVALVSGPQAGGAWLAIAAALGAAFSYGLAAVVMRRWAGGGSSRGMAAGTLLMGGWLLLPALAISPPPLPSPLLLMHLLALGLISGAIGYILYFRLIADIGPTGALTVTYLIPIFGVLWGALFLGEALSLHVVAGTLVVIAGTALVLRG